MKSFIYAIVFLVLSAGASVGMAIFSHRSFDWLVVILATIMGFMVGRVSQLQSDVKHLRDALARDWEERQRQAAKPVMTKTATAASEVSSAPRASVPASAEPSPTVATKEFPEPELTIDPVLEPERATASAYTRIPSEPNIIDKIKAAVMDYFTGGNMIVRIGILILFFGVSFLLKYASDQGVFPIEYRLMSVAAGAMGLLSFGWYLRKSKPTYGLLLQGAGIGILYMAVFAALSLYGLISHIPAFALMFAISMLAAALAVLQDSRSLAVLGFSGGFLAPILTSSGSNNYVGLFSYYVVLNIAIVTIAWFKAWRELNLLGFFFTFIVGTAWGVTKYEPANFSTVEPFLIVFFLFYVLIAVLFALRQPPKLRGYVDGSLLFGVPLAASGLQYGLLKDVEYGISFSAFAMGLFYLVLAWGLWKRAGDGLKLLSEAFLALGVIFASLAIPFALAPTHTAAAWGLEGLGLIWLGTRQQRLSVRIFGLLLQFGAGFFVFFHHDFIDGSPFLNGVFISSVMMAIAGILSARLMSREYQGRKVWEPIVSKILLVWGLLWLFGGFIHQMVSFFDSEVLIINSILLLAAVVSLIFMRVAMQTKPQWFEAWHVATGLLAVMLLTALARMAEFDIRVMHPFIGYGWLVWPFAFAVMYVVLFQLDKNNVYGRLREIIHTVTGLLLVAIITWEGMYQLLMFVSEESGWAKLWLAVPATIGLWSVVKLSSWPVTRNRSVYQQHLGTILAIYMILWGFFAVVSKGSSEPLPWIPLLNPLDITLAVVLISLFSWWKAIGDQNLVASFSQFKPNKSVFAISIAGLTFMWLNFTLFRVATHWFDVPYDPDQLYDSSLVQTATSVLWALSGVMMTVFASRYKMRTVWIAGSILLALVVLKLFTVDLSNLSSLSRIVSFLVVGALLTSIGYFAPLPEHEEKRIQKNKEADKL